jgi:arylsulfatase A-like enzyme
VRFTNGYVSCPVCSPSRAGFLTGRYQEKFGHEANPVAKFDGIFGLPLQQVTLAAAFKKLAPEYATAIYGKWHEGGKEEYRPLHRGFDEFFGFLGGMHVYVKPGVGDNVLREGDEPIKELKGYLTDVITDHAVSFIDRHKDQPFFMYVPYNAVHVPQQAPPKYRERFPDVKDEKRMLMLAMLSAEDDGVGRILAKLRDDKLEENTLVVFFSDNGGPTQGNASRNAPLRGFKGQVWEGGIRIPFMMQWKGRIPAGKVIDDPVISLDLFPTALAAAGLTPPAELKLDGVNLLPLLEGKATAKPHETLYWRFKPQWAIRDGDYKLLQSREGKPQLFDLSKDPGESHDLVAEKPEIAKQLQAMYDAWAATLMEPLWPGRQEGSNQEAAMLTLPDVD